MVQLTKAEATGKRGHWISGMGQEWSKLTIPKIGMNKQISVWLSMRCSPGIRLQYMKVHGDTEDRNLWISHPSLSKRGVGKVRAKHPAQICKTTGHVAVSKNNKKTLVTAGSSGCNNHKR